MHNKFKINNENKNMKKIYQLTIGCLMLCALMAFASCISCGHDNNSAPEQDMDEKGNIYVIGAEGRKYYSYHTACSNGDFDAARDYIGKMKEKFVDVKAEGDYKEIRAFSELIQEAERYVENEEVQYLASLNEEQANNRIILILNQRPIEGLEAAENACLGKDVWNFDINKDVDEITNYSPTEVKDYKRYITWCGNHNSRCTSILSIAIACGNQSLAQKILHSFRPDPELLLKGNRKNQYEDKYDTYDVYAHYTNASKDAAQKKYDEAVASGAF